MTATSRRGIRPYPGMTFSEEFRLRARALDAEARNKSLSSELADMEECLISAREAQWTAERRAMNLSRRLDAAYAEKMLHREVKQLRRVG